ncbi:SDR family NAD(P)-dependent oxidoreductase [Clostridium felsineum]|uniref:SDR family NAD(P)-dependent oxidoreductase n=1 Tax=Clostridium felsineum TaxID=36839 RepID=UPI00098C980A|nr:SDR family NAD(P)-dependent oxidoreductase [Clostridium felsineum]URZ17239.1 Polyketide synthase PksM [Clostridium felsineum DSM 794]
MDFFDNDVLGDLHSLENFKVKVQEISDKDIAIIGIDCKFPKADNINEYWNNIKDSKDCIDVFPDSRRVDIDKYLQKKGLTDDEIKYYIGGYLEEIDKFDYSFFNISHKEANLMDPNQRVFLQTAWGAIEDAGYGGNKIEGSNTGVFVGYSSDFENFYKGIVNDFNPASKALSIPGNIKSIIASRISYLLDLKGPSMLIDTACSSSLVAIHTACQSIRNAECTMAIVGSVKINIIPLLDQIKNGIGIASSDNKTKSFSDNSDGTGFGEGTAAILIKSLAKAIEDNDNIYAVIKGSAVNQDGASIGITAPNLVSQEEVISTAWKNADIDPETITYIESHGTGTKLGDPIEVSAITKAFEKYTNKKQFCALGAVKTNIGHLDNCSGMAGLVKAVLALKHKKIPPNINFNKPNKLIDFINSPVYVSNRLIEWDECKNSRRCGVSAFGLSGTNCHIVLEEAPNYEENIESNKYNKYIIAISAKSLNSLCNLVKKYRDFLVENVNINIESLCYTALTGRKHYTHRLAIVFENIKELIYKLNKLTDIGVQSIEESSIYYANHQIISTKIQNNNINAVTESEKQIFSNEINGKLEVLAEKIVCNYGKIIEEICELYIKGADADWNKLYKNKSVRKISIPIYSFEPKRCWVKEEVYDNDSYNYKNDYRISALFSKMLVDSMNIKIYNVDFNENNRWILDEHIVNKYRTVPGTTYIEMVCEVCKKLNIKKSVQLRNIIFISPLKIDSNEDVKTHMIINIQSNCYKFIVASKSEKHDWIKHVEGEFKQIDHNLEKLDIQMVLNKLEKADINNYKEGYKGVIETGPRWNVVKEVYSNGQESVVLLEIPKEYYNDMNLYYIHPSMLDVAANVLNKGIEHNPFLPFSYGKVEVYDKMPRKFSSYIKLKNKSHGGLNVISFDILLINEHNEVFTKISDYSIKQITLLDSQNEKQAIYHKISWRQNEIDEKNNLDQLKSKGKVLIMGYMNEIYKKIIDKITCKDIEIIEVQISSKYKKIQTNKYEIDNSRDSYEKLFQDIKNEKIYKILHVAALENDEEVGNLIELKSKVKLGLYNIIYMLQILPRVKFARRIELILISSNSFKVTDFDTEINAINAAYISVGKVIKQEYPQIGCRCIDIDKTTELNEILSEICMEKSPELIAYRDGKRYIPVIEPLKLVVQKETNNLFRSDGVYIITGGTGAIGLNIAKYISSKKKVNLVLISRSKFPNPKEWGDILSTKNDIKTCEIIERINEIVKGGSYVECLSADVSDFNDMKNAIIYAKEKFGKINGVVHCAGVAGRGLIFNKTDTEIDRVIKSKIYGTWIISKLVQDEQIDFCVFSSSVNAVFGGQGQVDYTAANSYIDAYVQKLNIDKKKAISINWGPWDEIGMAVDNKVNISKTIFKGLSTDTAIKAFEEILNTNNSQVIVGEFNWDNIKKDDGCIDIIGEHNKTEIKNIKKQEDYNINLKDNSNYKKSNTRFMINDIENKYDQNVESVLAKIWARVLEVDSINVFENFSNMGGDSILATYLFREIDKTFPDMLNISDIFTYSSVSEMAKYIESLIKESEDKVNEKSFTTNSTSDIDNMLDNILDGVENGEISINDVDLTKLMGGDN